MNALIGTLCFLSWARILYKINNVDYSSIKIRLILILSQEEYRSVGRLRGVENRKMTYMD